MISEHSRECILYPYVILVPSAWKYYDWLDENNVRYIVEIHDYLNPIIRFKFSEDVLAFKLKFGL